MKTINEWHSNGKIISLILNNRQVTARVHHVLDGTFHDIPAYDVCGIPKALLNHDNYLQCLQVFLKDTFVVINPCSDGTFRLYIHPRLRGGGWWDFCCSLTLISVGVALTVASGGIGSAAGAALIGSGVKGATHAWCNESNFSSDYFKQSLIGAATGAITGGCSLAAANCTTMAAQVIVNGIGGAVGRGVEAKLQGEEIKIDEVIMGGAIGAAAGYLASKSAKDIKDAALKVKDATDALAKEAPKNVIEHSVKLIKAQQPMLKEVSKVAVKAAGAGALIATAGNSISNLREGKPILEDLGDAVLRGSVQGSVQSMVTTRGDMSVLSPNLISKGAATTIVTAVEAGIGLITQHKDHHAEKDRLLKRFDESKSLCDESVVRNQAEKSLIDSLSEEVQEKLKLSVEQKKELERLKNERKDEIDARHQINDEDEHDNSTSSISSPSPLPSHKSIFEAFIGVENQIKEITSFLNAVKKTQETLRRLLLLSGPPGTGKTELAKLVSESCGYAFVSFQRGDADDKWLGGLEDRINNFFSDLKKKNQFICLFIDEIDAICYESEGSPQAGSYNHDLTVTLLQMQISNLVGSRVVLIGATNYLHKVKPAIKNRGEPVVKFRLPDRDVREMIIVSQLKKAQLEHKLRIEDDTISKQLADATTGWSPRQLRQYLESVKNNVLQAIEDKSRFRHTMLIQDFGKAFETAREVFREDYGKILSRAIIEPPKLFFKGNHDSKKPIQSLVGLSEDEKNILLGIQYFIANPDRYRGTGVEVNFNTIFYGPPGTGKTARVRAIADNCNALFITIDAGKYKAFGTDEELRKTFSLAKEFERAIIFIDEIDAIAHEESWCKELLQTELEGFLKQNDNVLVVIGATNFPERIADAINSRFPTYIEAPLPDRVKRVEIFKYYLSRLTIPLSDELQDNLQKTCDEFANQGEGVSHRDIKNIVSNAVRNLMTKQQATRSESIDDNIFLTPKMITDEIMLRKENILKRGYSHSAANRAAFIMPPVDEHHLSSATIGAATSSEPTPDSNATPRHHKNSGASGSKGNMGFWSDGEKAVRHDNFDNLKSIGLTFEKMPGDGHCLFHAVGRYCNQTQQALRNVATAHLEHNWEQFASFITLRVGETKESYLAALRDCEWADQVVIQVLMRLLDRPIIIVGPGYNLLNPPEIKDQFRGDPIFVRYNGSNHYDAYVLAPGYAGRRVLEALINRQQQSSVPQI